MTFEAKIIAEIFFYQVGLSGTCSKWEWTEYKKWNRPETQKHYEISDCLPSHFEYICNNPIRKKTISAIISASKFILELVNRLEIVDSAQY